MTFWIRRLRFSKGHSSSFSQQSHAFHSSFPPWKNLRFAWRQKKSFLKEMNWNQMHPIGDCLKKTPCDVFFFCGFPFFWGSCNRELHRTQTSLWPNWIQWLRSLCGLVVVPLVSWFFVALNAYRWLSTKCCWYSFCLSMFLSKVLKPVGPYCILKVKICWKSCKSQTNIQLCWDLVGSEVIWISVFKKLDVQWQVPVGKQVPNKFRH